MCVRFVDAKVGNIVFNSKDSMAGWEKLVSKLGCNKDEAKKYCDSYVGVVKLVPRIQFRRCKLGNINGNLSCTNVPMTTCTCHNCPTTVVDQVKRADHVKKLCGDVAPPESSKTCTVQCGNKLLALPDGFDCEDPMFGFCLLGKCYPTIHDCGNTTIKCSAK